ncbi:hypothetical protein [Streptomyces vinaceus]|uniref:hypothetical protein n=1 Tax=Streptomyces vinaceus TaxID=1960 RepID=UPI001E3D52D2|nr:hypothetical protein [Streptomyces vinaceus]
MRLHFAAESGKTVTRALVNEQAYAVVRALLGRKDPGPRLFAYWEGRAWHEVRAEELNACLREWKWYATVLSVVAPGRSDGTSRGSRARRGTVVARAVREVSGYLGNTPAVCRASYIDPRVVELYENGRTVAPALDLAGRGRPCGGQLLGGSRCSVTS